MPSCPAQKNKAQPIKQLAHVPSQAFKVQALNHRQSGAARCLEYRREKQERIERDFRERKWRQCCRALSHGWKNSTIFLVCLHFIYYWSFFFFNLCFVCVDIVISRPKQVRDVAHQDEVVRVLTNTLETTNVMDSFSSQCFRIINFMSCLKPYPCFSYFLEISVCLGPSVVQFLLLKIKENIYKMVKIF